MLQIRELTIPYKSKKLYFQNPLGTVDEQVNTMTIKEIQDLWV